MKYIPLKQPYAELLAIGKKPLKQEDGLPNSEGYF